MFYGHTTAKVGDVAGQMVDDTEYMSVSGICGKRKGWTKGRITKFLGEPDKLVRNPHYSTAAPMRLYDIDRVEAAEATAEFQDSMAKAEDRKITYVNRPHEARGQEDFMSAILLAKCNRCGHYLNDQEIVRSLPH